MLKISNGDFNINFNAGWKQNFDTAPLYAKKCDEHIKLLLDELHQDLLSTFEIIKKGFAHYSLLKNA